MNGFVPNVMTSLVLENYRYEIYWVFSDVRIRKTVAIDLDIKATNIEDRKIGLKLQAFITFMQELRWLTNVGLAALDAKLF